MTPRERVIRVLLFILSRPYRYTRRQIAKEIACSKDQIDEDIDAIRAAGIVFDQNTRYQCAILPDHQFSELKYLLPLTQEDRAKISRVFDYMSSKDALYLKKKFESLYDFQQLGLAALRRPALDRLNLLEAAKKQKQQVILKNYPSNSNTIENRRIEVFDINPEMDMVQSFDVDKKVNRHFRLTRMEQGVELTNDKWQYESAHEWKPTDVFRIAGKQVMVHLQLKIYAYNSLIDNYPKARGECFPSMEEGIFDFQARINDQFLGITNFIMANAGQVEIISPIELKEKVYEKIKILQESLNQNK